MFWIYVRQCLTCDKHQMWKAVFADCCFRQRNGTQQSSFWHLLPKCKTENRTFLFSLSYFLWHLFVNDGYMKHKIYSLGSGIAWQRQGSTLLRLLTVCICIYNDFEFRTAWIVFTEWLGPCRKYLKRTELFICILVIQNIECTSYQIFPNFAWHCMSLCGFALRSYLTLIGIELYLKSSNFHLTGCPAICCKIL